MSQSWCQPAGGQSQVPLGRRAATILLVCGLCADTAGCMVMVVPGLVPAHWWVMLVPGASGCRGLGVLELVFQPTGG